MTVYTIFNEKITRRKAHEWGRFDDGQLPFDGQKIWVFRLVRRPKLGGGVSTKMYGFMPAIWHSGDGYSPKGYATVSVTNARFNFKSGHSLHNNDYLRWVKRTELSFDEKQPKNGQKIKVRQLEVVLGKLGKFQNATFQDGKIIFGNGSTVNVYGDEYFSTWERKSRKYLWVPR